MMTVKEVSKLAGVSVRTLHHYDQIGLLKPAATTDTGYRLYDEKSMERLQTILLFRELRFPLRQIAAIINNPSFDEREALEQQVLLLEIERDRLDGIIAHAKRLIDKKGNVMDFKPYDESELAEWRKEAKATWGDTDAYRESAENEKRGNEPTRGADALMSVFAELGTLRGGDPRGEAAQAKIAELKQTITDNFYTCTNEILAELGQMYVTDARFTKTIDAAGGKGTAEFARDAICAFCGK